MADDSNSQYPEGAFDLPEELQHVSDNYGFMSQADDRACIIIGASFIDLCLERLLKKSMVVPVEELFNGGNSPLSTFSSKIEISHALGLIGKTSRKELNILRKIRNDAAHTWEPFDFSNKSVVSRLSEVGYLLKGRLGELSPRDEFLQFVNSISYDLVMKYFYIEPNMFFPLGQADSHDSEEDFWNYVINVQQGKEKAKKIWWKLAPDS